MKVQRVLVIGAGIGGLTAATALAQRGVEVDVVEIRPDAEVYGVGIIQPANAQRGLRSIGLLDEALGAGFPFAGNTFYDWKGELIADCPSEFGPDVPPFNALGRPALHRILRSGAERAGAKLTYGVTWESVEESTSGVTVALSNGVRTVYDLVVGFDGIRSPLRRHLFSAAHEPVFTGCSVWRVTVPRVPEATNLMLFQGAGSKAGLVPLSQDLMYLLHVTREAGNPRHEPADFRRLLVDRLAGYEGIVGELRDSLDPSDEIVYSPISEVWLPTPWYRGRVIVLGDAAHGCGPHLAQGAAMAIEDAVVLAEELESHRDLTDTLAAVMARRTDRVTLVQKVSQGIQAEEMAVTAESLAADSARMRSETPGRLRRVEASLNLPF
jgi:2-polyprenyl-6-methoxyphenol hydroxylase-like FAD-dependent oxidoreductase